MTSLGEQLPDLALQGPGDREVALAALHGDAPLVAIFLRHFG
jgi:hypothetical protein